MTFFYQIVLLNFNLNQDGRFTTGNPQEPDPRPPEVAHGTRTLQCLPEGPECPSPANSGPSPHRILQGMKAGNSKGESIIVPLTSCLTGLESVV